MGLSRNHGAYQRRKGANEERDVVNMLVAHGWMDAARQLSQTRDGGLDIVFGDGLYCVECKVRGRVISLAERNAWWDHMLDDAKKLQPEPLYPILTYRMTNKPAMARYFVNLIPGVRPVYNMWIESTLQFLLESVLHARLLDAQQGMRHLNKLLEAP